MRKWLAALILLSACSESPLVTGEKADANRVYLTQIEKGMSMQQVYDLMGDPYTKEVTSLNGNYYDVWYYITDKTELGQERITRHNLTPLIFNDGILQGWGNRFFKAVKSGQIDLEQPDAAPAPATPVAPAPQAPVPQAPAPAAVQKAPQTQSPNFQKPAPPQQPSPPKVPPQANGK
jgi:outer membrane protein assembly factor BamE (lipoprotein component of BamABCDE complex)